jgi:predicted ribosome quality control (RQC) complex YloA/Tae2 family protein
MTSIFIPSINKEISFSVGKNANNNFDIITNANEDDLWFHVDGEPSSHVIAHIADENLNKKQLHKIVMQAAVLCKSKSKAKSSKNVPILYTFIRNLVKTDVIGSVITSNTKSVVI